MTNKEIVQLLPKKNALRKELSEIDKQIKSLERKRSKISTDLAWLHYVNLIWKGIALQVTTWNDIGVSRVIEKKKNYRTATVFKSTKKIYSTMFYERGSVKNRLDSKTKKAALELAYDWVAK